MFRTMIAHRFTGHRGYRVIQQIIAHRGRNIGVVAAARKLLTYVYYGLRDGQIRALAKGAA